MLICEPRYTIWVSQRCCCYPLKIIGQRSWNFSAAKPRNLKYWLFYACAPYNRLIGSITSTFWPPPRTIMPKFIVWMWAVNVKVVSIWTSETSLAKVKLLNSGCWAILMLRCVTPPVLSVTVPTTTLMLFCARFIVQWLAEITQRIDIIEAPQKCKFAWFRSDAYDGICPKPTFVPPTILFALSLPICCYCEILITWNIEFVKYLQHVNGSRKIWKISNREPLFASLISICESKLSKVWGNLFVL